LSIADAVSLARSFPARGRNGDRESGGYERVVVDGAWVFAAGVTAGIDGALRAVQFAPAA